MVFSGYSVSSANKTDSHDITENSVEISIINQTLTYLITVSYIEVIFGKVPLMTLVLFGRNCKSSYIKIIAHLLKCRVTVIHKFYTEQTILLETTVVLTLTKYK
jgi:hypothetical protein